MLYLEFPAVNVSLQYRTSVFFFSFTFQAYRFITLKLYLHFGRYIMDIFRQFQLQCKKNQQIFMFLLSPFSFLSFPSIYSFSLNSFTFVPFLSMLFTFQPFPFIPLLSKAFNYPSLSISFPSIPSLFSLFLSYYSIPFISNSFCSSFYLFLFFRLLFLDPFNFFLPL